MKIKKIASLTAALSIAEENQIGSTDLYERIKVIASTKTSDQPSATKAPKAP